MGVRHVTRYDYDGDVVASFNEARVTPVSTLNQMTLDSRVEVRPAASVRRYWDYWGTLVHAFDIHAPHRFLEVTATSTIETTPLASVEPVAPLGWDELASDKVQDTYYEYLAPSAMVDVDESLAAAMGVLRGETPADTLAAVVAWVQTELVYEKGYTTSSTPALDAWRAGRGVCQDFVHLCLAGLRTFGIPARYVSGYFHPEPDAAVGDTVEAESHAWVEAWLGDWHPVDPTNSVPVGLRHVVVARGREYRDVPPLKGIYSGAPPALPAVTVEITRFA